MLERGEEKKIIKDLIDESNSTNYLDRRIIAIQKSTKVRFPFLQVINEKLRQKFKWYYNWRIDPLYQYDSLDAEIATWTTFSRSGYGAQ